jgi:hypothetical protein
MKVLFKVGIIGVVALFILIIMTVKNIELKSSSEKSTEREIVLREMERRPHDSWPRGVGHVLLGEPGSSRMQKAYHEPGGSFSPSPGSFGVSFWVKDEKGSLIATSDNIPLNQIKQDFAWLETAGIPAIKTKTPFYNTVWSFENTGRWQLDLKMKTEEPAEIFIVIRSVGPAGGPITSLDWDDNRLLINNRWIVKVSPDVKSPELGDEKLSDWTTKSSGVTSWRGEDGWGYALIGLSEETDCQLFIKDTKPQFKSPLTYSGIKTNIKLNLPDKIFISSLEAQATNLMMGFVGSQICPGEPTNYPLAWERDGAYVLMAMARCGQIEVARELAVYFAENDFFGGFGAESDAPGSAINALVEVALILEDSGFNQWLWPHILRKTELIKEMLAAGDTIRKPWVGPIVPSLIGKETIPITCLASKGGLIVGSMDNHYPILYVNAITYRGLIQAAKLAELMEKEKEARDFRTIAALIQKAWIKALNTDEAKNPRTYMSGIWPSWIIGADFEPYRGKLQERWENKLRHLEKQPLWTYFLIGETHQWLFSGDPDKAWEILTYFWDNQCSPGLYTYWEGEGEENSFGLWKDIRGWVRPPHVTPHYWTAAEMLLLQLDMLAYVDESDYNAPELVIGAGLPPEWLDSSMSVQNLRTNIGEVDWTYKEDWINVVIHTNKKFKVRLGPSFSINTNLRVEYK